MKNILLRTGRILLKLLLLAYVFAVNTLLILFFYALLYSIARLFVHDPFAALIEWSGLPKWFWVNLPIFIVGTYMLYALSPFRTWILRWKERYDPVWGEEKQRIERLLAELEIKKKFTVYRSDSPDLNACAFGFRSIAVNEGLLNTLNDRELKAVLCHEIGHLEHRDYVYSVLNYTMEKFGYRSFVGIFRILAVPFGFLGANNLKRVYLRVEYVLFRLPDLCRKELDKHSEYRCDGYALRYGCADGLISFFHKIRELENRGPRMTFGQYIRSAHPATSRRIARLQKKLAREGGGIGYF